jgi:fructose-specific phosphotransferase system component IIB
MSKTITIDVAPDGGVKIETKGFSGAECQRATAEIERALGPVKVDMKTAEFHQAQRTKQ